MKSVKIIIADDHSLVRLGLSSLIKSQDDMEVVGEAKNGKEAVEVTISKKPDIIIMDLMMPIMNGAEATRQIHKNSPATRVLILTSYGTSADIQKASASGASGAILKDTSNEILLKHIRTIAAGGTAFSPDIKQAMDETPNIPKFTERQMEILHSVTRGLTNRDISKQLGISPDGVKVHINAILSKLGAATRTEAVAIALRKHLLKI